MEPIIQQLILSDTDHLISEIPTDMSVGISYACSNVDLDFERTPKKIGMSYLAGFLDGDGSIVAQIVERSDYVLKYQLRVRVSFTQKTRRKHFLLQIQKELGGKGCVRERPDGVSEFAIVGQNDVGWFLKQIAPMLHLKKKQAYLVLKIIEQLPLTKNSPEKFLDLCTLADHVSELNDSKNRKCTTQVVRERFQDLKGIKE